VNEYLRDLYDRVPHDWTPLSELDAEWAHLNELAQDGYLDERVEKLEQDGLTAGSRFYYRKPRPGAYYTPSDVCGDVYDPVMGSGGFLAAMSNPEYSKDA